MGVPRADGYWGFCNKKNIKNYRTRCSVLISKGNNNILINTSPDLRFQLLRNKVKNLYSERFCKIWEFYLAASETAFRYLGMTVYQIQLTKQSGIIPITRDYIEGSKNKIVANNK